LLKVFGFFAALWAAIPAAAAVADVAGLIVGSIRDEDGVPLTGAAVTVVDAAGRTIGRDVVDARGTFAARTNGDPVAVEITCRHCAPARLRLDGRTEITAVVRHYTALERPTPDAADLAALPYGRIVDALALTPLTLPAAGGTAISDRGLGGGHGLVVDDGAPLGDFATTLGGLADFPDRYARTLAIAAPATAYRYAGDGGGGRFLIDQFDGDESAAALDGGAASALALEPSLGPLHPSLGISSDDGTLARRAGLDAGAPFAGGYLRAGFASASLETPAGEDFARTVDLVHVAYATASRAYRTFVSISAAESGIASESTGASEYGSSYVDADARVERPGPVTLAFGVSAIGQSAYEAAPPYVSYDLTGRLFDKTAYVEAFAGNARASFDAGLGVGSAALGESLLYTKPSDHDTVLLPSLAGRLALGADAYVRGAYSESAQLPSLAQADVVTPFSGLAPGFDRGELLESALGFDGGGRVTAEAVAYREFRRGIDESDLDGTGLSVAWQAAPRLTVRAWSLRDVPSAVPVPETSPAAFAGTDLTGKQLTWLTYANGPDGLRFDAIAHRDVTASAATVYLDGGVLVPLVAHLAIAAGTVQHGARTYYLGLRAR
jgi:hypothetical protein